MSQFRKDTKKLIVNSDDQLVVQTPDGGAVIGNADPIVNLIGFLDTLYTEDWVGEVPVGKPQLTGPATKEIAKNAAKEVKTFKVTTAQTTELERVILAYTSISGEQAEFHNHPKRKYYQVKAGATAAEIATNIVAAINADENAPVKAKIDDRVADVDNPDWPVEELIVLEAKKFDITFDLYSDAIAFDKADTAGITVKGTNGLNTYEQLKNIFWSNPITDSSEFDRREAFLPRKGAKYTAFRFQTKTDVGYLGSHDVADADQGRLSYSEYIIYVNETLADLITSLSHAVERV